MATKNSGKARRVKGATGKVVTVDSVEAVPMVCVVGADAPKSIELCEITTDWNTVDPAVLGVRMVGASVFENRGDVPQGFCEKFRAAAIRAIAGNATAADNGVIDFGIERMARIDTQRRAAKIVAMAEDKVAKSAAVAMAATSQLESEREAMLAAMEAKPSGDLKVVISGKPGEQSAELKEVRTDLRAIDPFAAQLVALDAAMREHRGDAPPGYGKSVMDAVNRLGTGTGTASDRTLVDAATAEFQLRGEREAAAPAAKDLPEETEEDLKGWHKAHENPPSGFDLDWCLSGSKEDLGAWIVPQSSDKRKARAMDTAIKKRSALYWGKQGANAHNWIVYFSNFTTYKSAQKRMDARKGA